MTREELDARIADARTVRDSAIAELKQLSKEKEDMLASERAQELLDSLSTDDQAALIKAVGIQGK